MQILRLLAARRFRRRRRRAVSTITATATAPVTPRGGGAGGCMYGYGEEEDEGPFFDLDLTCCSAPASSAGSQAAESGSESEDTSSCGGAASAGGAARSDLDFVISLHRSRPASPSYEERLFCRGAAPARPPPLMFCASEPSDAASRSRARHSSSGGRLRLRTLSFGSAKAAFFAAYDQDLPDEGRALRPPSGDVFRRYLSKISSRLRRVGVGVSHPGAATDQRLRKSRSASAAQASAVAQSPPPRRDDSLAEKQDGIASAIAHCKESLHRASVSEAVDTSLARSRSDPGP